MVRMTQNDGISVRCELQGELAKEFDEVKKNLGLRQNTEVIRKLIRDAYLALAKEAA